MRKGKKERINNQVNETVRVVGEEGLGEEISKKEGLAIAEEQGLDLVEMSSKGGVSICKVLDYQKYAYEKKKAKKETTKGNNKGQKEIRFGSNISDHDLQIRANNTLRLIKGGYEVKVTLQIRGRNRTQQIGVAKELMQKYEAKLDEGIEIDKAARVEGHNIVMYLKSK